MATDELDVSRIGFGFTDRAVFAVDPAKTAGRVFPEPESPTRTVYQRDRDRIIHSNAFRRLKHKTQVFISDEGDHYRTRLTHSIEVAQIARSIARAFRLDEDLTEALALAHDFGHTPFGHAGERALDAATSDFGGFDHNLQSLRVVSKMERRYPRFDGLNLSWETLEGLAKHNGPVAEPLAGRIQHLLPSLELKLNGYASLEAQAAAISDDIAYDTHDIDDGLRSGLLTLAQLRQVPLLRRLLDGIEDEFAGLDAERTGHELSRRLITLMVEDVIAETQRRLQTYQPDSADAVRAASQPLLCFSAPFSFEEKELKEFLFRSLYRHPSLMQRMVAAEKIVQDLFAAYMSNIEEIPGPWRHQFAPGPGPMGEHKKARMVADYIAGMTDSFASQEHRRLHRQHGSSGLDHPV
uniref:deoxyguanosinetriphosphate triphosphohydrolase n=1 Tax=Pararhizobium sp. IMCC3301 TaxID=3067904 RepID=UPI002741A36D|nr:deoxyguanosinetriphosphate triphosphohydrolase [Pararhizobium sp. IMCC3301]